MMASMRKRGLLSLHLVYMAILGPPFEDVDIQFHASYVNNGSPWDWENGGNTMNVNTYDENLCLFFQALSNVSKEYVVYLCETGNDVVTNEHCERAFAYELYRQWENLLKDSKSEFILNGEIGKLLSKFDDSSQRINEKEKYPDLVLHKGQGEFTGQEIICEIKRSYQINNLEDDLDKLKIFTNGNFYYKWGILLIYGMSQEENIPILDFNIFKTKEEYKSKFTESNGEIFDFIKGEILIVSLEYRNNNEGPIIRFDTLSHILTS